MKIKIELWDATKAILRGNFIVIDAYIKKLEQSPKKSNITPQGTRKRRTN